MQILPPSRFSQQKGHKWRTVYPGWWMLHLFGKSPGKWEEIWSDGRVRPLLLPGLHPRLESHLRQKDWQTPFQNLPNLQAQQLHCDSFNADDQKWTWEGRTHGRVQASSEGHSMQAFQWRERSLSFQKFLLLRSLNARRKIVWVSVEGQQNQSVWRVGRWSRSHISR